MTDLQGSGQQTKAPADQASTPSYAHNGSGSRRAASEVTGWVGWIVFAATVMLMVGMFHAIAGLVALFQKDYYLVNSNGLVVHVNYTAWGWTYLIGGVIMFAAGAGLLAGQMWARVVAVILAVLSTVLNMAFFAAYPWWSALMIVLDVLVIWALTVHGSEMKAAHQS